MPDSKDSPLLPAPVQMKRPSNLSAVEDGLSTGPRNNVLISRTFGGLDLEGKRITVDPNLRMPDSVVREWSYWTPSRNLELAVTFGSIAANVDVLPLAGGAPGPKRFRAERASERKPYQAQLKFGTGTGNLTVHIRDAPPARIYLQTSANFGQTRIYLPRTFRGALSISSRVRAPCLSAALQRACTPVSQEGSTMRWFVGDVAEGGEEDYAEADTTLGSVWIGYVGEEDEGARALGWAGMHWAKTTATFMLMCYVLYWVPWLLWQLFSILFAFLF
ncbi:hypothetical protein B0H15DRAFT_653265 [Mycena belliarum]|uniref:DUF7330 domain-containing protein n=1 Tax=Mycena belliarum TaxID=1033014 RepID=A0AAD6TRW7_9AGAR|nr:hypothetical protein B0H15DRAFT_653265 [Mycena belliae]